MKGERQELRLNYLKELNFIKNSGFTDDRYQQMKYQTFLKILKENETQPGFVASAIEGSVSKFF